MITLTISDEVLQSVFEGHLKSLLETGNYDNPVKKAFDKLLGYNGELTNEFNAQIKTMALEAMKTPWFAASLGDAMAKELAKREIDRLKNK